ncbi:response regulator [Pedobacter lithocola]|uniref:Response regulator n=1 Tax=Pedobacter lithocola TaxID=1908239 RepID=A0ABV8P3R6_9SPHI
MIKKVLIAEDHSMASISIVKIMEDLSIPEILYTYYCDDALMHIRKAIQVEAPFDLLVTDLSFEADHREQHLKNGEQLIASARAIQPSLKVLVFSGEGRPAIIGALYRDLVIDAYVRKGREDSAELNAAMKVIDANKLYMPAEIRRSVNQKNSFEFSTLDVTIVSLLSSGTKQKNIPAFLQANAIKPSGLSSVEKRLSTMREVLGFSNNEQLIAYCKDFGII